MARSWRNRDGPARIQRDARILVVVAKPASYPCRRGGAERSGESNRICERDIGERPPETLCHVLRVEKRRGMRAGDNCIDTAVVEIDDGNRRWFISSRCGVCTRDDRAQQHACASEDPGGAERTWHLVDADSGCDELQRRSPRSAGRTHVRAAFAGKARSTLVTRSARRRRPPGEPPGGPSGSACPLAATDSQFGWRTGRGARRRERGGRGGAGDHPRLGDGRHSARLAPASGSLRSATR